MDTIRKGTVHTLADALESQRLRKVDYVLKAPDINFGGTVLHIEGQEVHLTEDGVTDPNGLYVPTRVAIDGIGRKLGIHTGYLNRLAMEHADLFATNVNTLAERSPEARYLLRLLKSDDPADDYGTLRAVLSANYRAIDNFDVLMALLGGLRDAGAIGSSIEADLTERRMIVRVQSDVVAVNASALVENYRSPFSGKSGKDLPLVWAGLVVDNSELGHGAFHITPRGVFDACTNGYTHTADSLKRVHTGADLSDGVVKWSDETIAANLALVTAQTKDAVRTFLTPEYWEAKVKADTADASVPIDQPNEVLDSVGRSLGFTAEQRTDILNMFIDGADRTAGGVMQAVTASAQTQSDGDIALEMEALGREAMRLAAHPRILARAGSAAQ